MYIFSARPTCLRLDVQLVCRAFSRAWAKTGKRMAARIAIMAMTTSSSISVNPARLRENLVLMVGSSFIAAGEFAGGEVHGASRKMLGKRTIDSTFTSG